MTFLLCTINILVFTVELCIGGINDDALLAANPDTLTVMGNKNVDKMLYEYQIWRFFTPMFLHANLTHLLGNLLGTMVLGSSLEGDLGKWKFLALYILSGMGGILFSCVCDNTQSCGASTAIFGLVGSYVAFLILNWAYLKEHTDRRCQIFIFLAFSLIMSIGLASQVRNLLTSFRKSMYSVI